MSQALVVRCPSCATRLRLQPGKELPERFKVRCSACGKPFLVRRQADPGTTSGGALDETLAGEQVTTRGVDDQSTHFTAPAAASPAPAPPAPAAPPAAPAPAPGSRAVSPARHWTPPPRVTPPPTQRGPLAPRAPGAPAEARREPPAAELRGGATFAPGEVVAGRYRIERFLAKGGMGEVYAAFDTALGEELALKTVRPDVAADESALERFKREIHLARRVTHRNVCRIHDLGTHRSDSALAALYPNGEILFVTMELLRGETLADRLAREGPLSEEAALPLLRQLAAGLDAAHAAGIVHRDFKCANVVLETVEGGGTRAVITDFGLARGPLGGEGGATLTVAGAVMGSPAYMAPEQVDGGAVTPAADLYALGVVLFEALTGKLPFKGESPLSTAVKRLSEPPPRPSSVRAGIDPRWEQAILRCLARRPEERFATAGDIVTAVDPSRLQSALGTPNVTRRRLVLAVAAGFLIALALVVNFWVWQRRAERNAGLEVPSMVRPAVAVLGLKNVTADPELDWLSSGLPEMLTSELSTGGAVRLIPGENVARAQQELALEPGATWGSETLEQLRRFLGSDYVVTGSYAAVGEGAGGQLRLDLRLQDTLTAGNSTAVAVTGPRAEVFSLVAEAGARLRDALHLEGGGTAWKGENPEAARLYAQGLERLRNFDALGARERLEQAVALEPRNPRLQSALANALSQLGYVEKAREAARRAVDLSAPLAEGERQQIRAEYLELAGDWPAAARAWEELFRREPDNLEYGLKLAQALVPAGDPRRSAQVASLLRRLPSAAADDVRIFFAEATAASALGQFREQQQAAAKAAEVALGKGARLERARALLLEGWALRNLGDAGRAQGVTAEAEGLFQQAGDESGVATARVQRATLLYDQGELASARRLFEQALATYTELGDKGNQAQALNNLALVMKQAGEVAPALALYEQSRQLSEETGNRIGIANAENNVGAIRLKRGDLAGALRSFERSLELSRAVGDGSQEAYALYNVAATLRKMGRLADAEARHREALELRRRIGQRLGEVASLTELAGVMADRGEVAAAARAFEEALVLARETGNRRFEAYGLAGLAQARLDAGDLAQAERLHREALALREQLGELGAVGESRMALAGVAVEQGRFAEAETLARQAAEQFVAEGAIDLAARAQALRARSLVFLGRAAEAQQAAQAAGERGATSEDLRARCEVRLAQARVAGAAGRDRDAVQLVTEVAAEAEASGLLPVLLEARLLEAQLLAGSGQDGRAAQLVADVRGRAERSGLGLMTRKAHL